MLAIIRIGFHIGYPPPTSVGCFLLGDPLLIISEPVVSIVVLSLGCRYLYSTAVVCL